MQLPAVAATLDRLVTLTSPGAPVAPVVAALDEVASGIAAAAPALEQARASQWLLGEMQRVGAASRTLRDALAQLATQDGMTTFDPAFVSDDAQWDTWFEESAIAVRRAEGFLAARAQPAIVSATSV